VLLGFRPESVEMVGPGEGFKVIVNLVEELGADAYIYGSIPGHRVDDEGSGDITARVEPMRTPRIGETVQLRVRPGLQHSFSPKTGLRLT